jgi:hypothetical protein
MSGFIGLLEVVKYLDGFADVLRWISYVLRGSIQDRFPQS